MQKVVLDDLIENNCKQYEPKNNKNNFQDNSQDWLKIIEKIVQNDKLGAPESLSEAFITGYNSNGGKIETTQIIWY